MCLPNIPSKKVTLFLNKISSHFQNYLTFGKLFSKVPNFFGKFLQESYLILEFDTLILQKIGEKMDEIIKFLLKENIRFANVWMKILIIDNFVDESTDLVACIHSNIQVALLRKYLVVF